MKIKIIIGLNPYFQSSASANRWRTLIDGLSKSGARVTLLIYGGYQSVKESNDWQNSADINGIAIKYIAPQLIEGYWKSRYYIYIGEALRESYLIKLIQNEIENNEGIVWTDASHFGFKLAVQLKKHLPIQQIFLELSEFLDIHKYNKGNFMQRWQANKRQKFFEERAFHAYDGLALMTKTLLNHYKQFPEPSPELLHLPMTVDLDRFANEIEPLPEFVKPYIVFVGVMNDAKDGVRILIKAFAKISNEFPELKLYLIGGWNYDTPIHKQLIKEFRLEDKIFWKGEFNRDQIPAIIKNATLLALPRPDSKQAQGGFPTKLGEYLATGNPVCATTVGEIPDYLTDRESVYFAEPGSINSFANAMQRALSKPEEAKRIGMNGRKVAEKSFNKDIQAKILFNFLKENLQSNNRKG
jgi:glycosyltransferase involved in cell wall biosynthesis